MAVKAIETNYQGCRFRSRLEARWAVFFEHITVKWKYEPQGYQIGFEGRTRNYLPDFYLPDLDVWVEVKGDNNRIDWGLLGTAVDAWSEYTLPDSRWAYSGHMYGPRGHNIMTPGRRGSAIIILGDIPHSADEGNEYRVQQHVGLVNAKGVCAQWWDFVHQQFEAGNQWRDLGYYDSSTGDKSINWNGAGEAPSVHGRECWYEKPNHRAAQVVRAYTAARRARFEHGEKG